MADAAVGDHRHAPPAPRRATALKIAVICGTPTPLMIRVVQIEPGPMPTFTASAPASIRSRAPSRRGDVAGDHLNVAVLLDLADGLDDILAVPMGGIDDAPHRHRP